MVALALTQITVARRSALSRDVRGKFRVGSGAPTTRARARVASRRREQSRRANRVAWDTRWIRRIGMTREGAERASARTRRARGNVVRNTEDARVADGTRTARRARGDGDESASIARRPIAGSVRTTRARGSGLGRDSWIGRDRSGTMACCDRSARSKCARKTDWSFVVCFRSRVGRKTVKARAAVKVAASSDLKFDDDWKKSSVPVHLASLFGWVIPSASPCPAFENNASLFQVFSDRIGANLANFPQGPAADDKIWLYMLTWHMGLFACMMFGQIGVQARKQGYFN